jgi:hemerythrin
MSWNNGFSVEVESLDKQHQRLFAMLNELHDAMKAGKGKLFAPAILERLVDYTREHFAAEEALMKRANYPDFASHKAEHEKLKNEIAKMLKNAEGGDSGVSMELSDFLREWLKTHILQRDKQYSGHLRTAGIC